MRARIHKPDETRAPAALPPAATPGRRAAVVGALAGLAVAGSAATAFAQEGGLPQLNPATFAPQIVWLVISFVALYLVMSKVALPRVMGVLDARQGRIEDSLSRAEALKVQASEVLTQYETSMNEARARAHEAVRAVTQEGAAESARRHAELGARILERIEQAEKRIDQAKRAAMGELHSLAIDVGGTVTERVAGVKPSPQQIAAAVDGVVKERR